MTALHANEYSGQGWWPKVISNRCTSYTFCNIEYKFVRRWTMNTTKKPTVHEVYVVHHWSFIMKHFKLIGKFTSPTTHPAPTLSHLKSERTCCMHRNPSPAQHFPGKANHGTQQWKVKWLTENSGAHKCELLQKITGFAQKTCSDWQVSTCRAIFSQLPRGFCLAPQTHYLPQETLMEMHLLFHQALKCSCSWHFWHHS